MRGRKPALETIRRRLAAPYVGPLPECPYWLDEDAKLEWARVAPELAKQGIFEPTGAMSLAAYCQAYSQWMKAELQVRADGLMIPGPQGNDVLHPAARHAAKLLSEMRRAAAELGITPASRTRVDTPPKQDKEGDDFDAFIGSDDDE